MGGSFVVDWRLIGATLFGLFMFGVAYSFFMGALAERKDGILAQLVAAGVGITLIGVAIISWQAAILVLACFIASGTPMIVGENIRSIMLREKSKRIMLQIAEADVEHITKIADQIDDQG